MYLRWVVLPFILLTFVTSLAMVGCSTTNVGTEETKQSQRLTDDISKKIQALEEENKQLQVKNYNLTQQIEIATTYINEGITYEALADKNSKIQAIVVKGSIPEEHWLKILMLKQLAHQLLEEYRNTANFSVAIWNDYDLAKKAIATNGKGLSGLEFNHRIGQLFKENQDVGLSLALSHDNFVNIPMEFR